MNGGIRKPKRQTYAIDLNGNRTCDIWATPGDKYILIGIEHESWPITLQQAHKIAITLIQAIKIAEDK